jgi:hypothetical protein
MKKVIDGALYNTDTARQIGHAEPSGPDTRNFQYFCETLYQTKSGKYFLHGEGHGNSRYGVWHGNTGGWGEKIMPMTPEEAREWAEENLDADIYSEEFGEPEEAADGREALNVSIAKDTKRKLEKMKSEKGKSIGQLIDEWISTL